MNSVLEMALEALQGMRDMWASVCISHGWEPNHLPQYDDAGKAIAALKEAIKNQGEPVRGAYFDGVSVVLCAIGHEHGQRLYTSASTIPAGWQQATHANAPKYGERVIVLTTDADGDPIPEFAHYNGELGFLGIGGKRIKPVSYWMPSPAAPKGDKP